MHSGPGNDLVEQEAAAEKQSLRYFQEVAHHGQQD